MTNEAKLFINQHTPPFKELVNGIRDIEKLLEHYQKDHEAKLIDGLLDDLPVIYLEVI
jgi:hypothetical protein